MFEAQWEAFKEVQFANNNKGEEFLIIVSQFFQSSECLRTSFTTGADPVNVQQIMRAQTSGSVRSPSLDICARRTHWDPDLRERFLLGNTPNHPKTILLSRRFIKTKSYISSCYHRDRVCQSNRKPCLTGHLLLIYQGGQREKGPELKTICFNCVKISCAIYCGLLRGL